MLDLFAGCGGLSLGFQRAGCQIIGAVELDAKAARSHALNFPGVHTANDLTDLARDITTLPPADFARLYLNQGDTARAVDIIVGGPPCQAFARIGRAKLRALMADPRAHLNDDRASLYTNFLEYVMYFRPLAVVMENVPDIMNFGGKNVVEEIAASLDDLGYRTSYTILNAAWYGVPQLRQRVILLAIRDSLDTTPSFPTPTHFIELPDGYADARRSVLKVISQQLLLFDKSTRPTHYIEPPPADTALPPAITTAEALGDLPLLYSEEIRKGAKAFVTPIPYRSDTSLSNYAAQMRDWPGFAAGPTVCDHVTRYLPRDYQIFREMEPGDEYPQALEIALSQFHAARSALLGHPHGNSRIVRDLRRRHVPPYDAKKFPNKWRKMDRERPAHTLTAHLGKDSYTHIHYDSAQARTITVREAARLQSFPDGFRFEGPMNAAFRQIGNAVPPLLAFAVASHLCQLVAASPQRDLSVSGAA